MNTFEAPTWVRWRVILATTLMSVLLYLDRFCISTAEIYIKEDLGLSNEQIAYVIAAFFWSYALAQVSTGWLADRFGARTMLTIYILSWSLFTGLLGFANGFAALFLLRLGIGIAQAGAYPAGVGVVRNWMPLSRRGTGSSIVTFGGRVGGTLALLLTGYVILYFVPTSISSLIQPADVMDVGRLCHEIAATHSKGPGDLSPELGRVVLTRLSENSKAFVQDASDRHADYLAAVESDPSKGSKPVTSPTSALLSDPRFPTFLSDINAMLEIPSLFSESQLKGLPLENEGRRLLKRGSAQLNSGEVTRLNRLVFEARHRESIRKVYVAGWRNTMIVYGSLGIFVASIFWLTHRTLPSDHPRCNQAERELIGQSAAAAPEKRESLPMKTLLTDRSMWLNCLMQFTTNVGWLFIVTLTPRYFAEKHAVPLETRSLMVAIPPTAGWIGMLLGGWLTDRITADLGLRWGRALPIVVTRLGAALVYLALLLEPGPWTAVIAFSLVAFCVDLAIGAVWAFQQDIGGKYVGAILGWGNMWGNFGAAIAPVAALQLLDYTKSWEALFLCGAIAFAVSGLASLGIDATKPIMAEPKNG